MLKNFFLFCAIMAITLHYSGCFDNSIVLNSNPSVKKGIIDLRNWDFSRDGSINLEGDWKFYWKDLIDPGTFKLQNRTSEPYFAEVPGEWNRVNINGTPAGGIGYASYQLTIFHNTHERLAFEIPKIYTAFRMYANGKLIAQAGIVGVTEMKSESRFMPQIASFNPESGRTEIVIHVSNFHHSKGGICRYLPFMLGSEKSIQRSRDRKIILIEMLIGAFIMIGLFNLILFIQRMEEYQYLFFSIAMIAYSVWMLVASDGLIDQLFTGMPWWLLIRLEYFSMYISFTSYVLFTYYLFRGDSQLIVVRVIVYSMIPMLFTLVFPSYFFTGLSSVFHMIIISASLYFMYVLYGVIKRREERVYIFTFGYLIAFVAQIFNIMFHKNLFHNPYAFVLIMPLLVFVVVLFHSLFLAMRYTDAYRLAMELSADLDRKVRERTGQLEQSSRIIEKVSDGQKEMLRMLCHDLSAPFLSMKYLLKLVREAPERFSSNRDRFLEEITSSVETSLDLIQKVRNMSESEEQAAVTEPVNLKESVELAKIILKRMLEKKRIVLHSEMDPAIKVLAEQATFLNSVLLNFIINAVKFSPEGFAVKISARRVDEMIMIDISDHGIGMPEEMVENIFANPAKYRRAGTSGEKGSGFGLAIARKFIWFYGGDVAITSRYIDDYPDDHGTTVTISMKPAGDSR